MSNRILRITIGATVALSAMLGGCPPGGDGSAGPQTVIRFAQTRITLYVQADAAEVAASLHSDGLTVQAGEQLDPSLGLDFLVTGEVGTLSWGANVVQVEANGIRINGTLVESDDSILPADRAVVLTQEGDVIPDAFLPFEQPSYGFGCHGKSSR
jgi:hypothetical protein